MSSSAELPEGWLGSRLAPRSLVLCPELRLWLLGDDVDLSRGDLIAASVDTPAAVTEFTATVTQLAEKPLRPGTRALLRYGASSTRALVTSLDHLLHIDSLTYGAPPDALALNDIALVTIRTADPLPVEPYRAGGAVGSLLIIDPADGTTLSAGMVGDRLAALHPDRATTSGAATENDEEDWLS